MTIYEWKTMNMEIEIISFVVRLSFSSVISKLKSGVQILFMLDFVNLRTFG